MIREAEIPQLAHVRLMTLFLDSEEIEYQSAECSFGTIVAAVSETGLCCLTLGDDSEILVVDLRRRFPRATIRAARTGEWIGKVLAFVEAPGEPLDLPLDIRGTVFQQRVWRALMGISPGATATYSQIAREMGHPQAVRAVAGACAANSIAIAIPCHRVIRNDGTLSGYRWGIERKRALLERERSGIV